MKIKAKETYLIITFKQKFKQNDISKISSLNKYFVK